MPSMSSDIGGFGEFGEMYLLQELLELNTVYFCYTNA